eukprot:5008675-Prymnesium_polylepis.1
MVLPSVAASGFAPRLEVCTAHPLPTHVAAAATGPARPHKSRSLRARPRLAALTVARAAWLQAAVGAPLTVLSSVAGSGLAEQGLPPLGVQVGCVSTPCCVTALHSALRVTALQLG